MQNNTVLSPIIWGPLLLLMLPRILENDSFQPPHHTEHHSKISSNETKHKTKSPPLLFPTHTLSGRVFAFDSSWIRNLCARPAFLSVTAGLAPFASAWGKPFTSRRAERGQE